MTVDAGDASTFPLGIPSRRPARARETGLPRARAVHGSIPHGRWILEGGRFDIAVGASSRDIRLRALVDAPASSPAGETRRDGDTPGVARRRRGADAAGGDRDPPRRATPGILGDEHLQTIIGNFPISTLATFGDLGIDHAAVKALVQRVNAPPTA